MKIGELAARSATSAQTIRYYERQGLLPPPARSAANYRHYGPAHAARLGLIRRCRVLGMDLDEVRALLALVDEPGRACAGVDALLDTHIQHVNERLAELQALQAELLALRARCGGQGVECGIVQGLREGGPVPRPAAGPHARGVHGSGNPA